MKLPRLKNDILRQKKYIINFGGLNKGVNAAEGELSECFNLSSFKQPYIYPRGKREETGDSFENATSFFAQGDLCVVDGESFKYKAAGDTEFSEKMKVTAGRKQIARIGDMIIVLPDKKYYDVKNNKTGSIVGEMSLECGRNSYWWSINGGKNLEIWDKLAQYVPSDYQDKTQVLYGQIAAELYKKGDTLDMRLGDMFSGTTGIYVAAVKATVRNAVKTVDSAGITRYTMTFDDNTFRTLSGDVIQSAYGGTGTHIIKKTDVPDMKHMCTFGGRVWGTADNTIYASAYLDPLNFEKFDGLSGDSYYINCLSPGEFTGCAAYSTHVCFFKENTIHKIYGNRPSNFNMVEINAPGIETGSENFVANVRETLYYKSNQGICAYTGGMPTVILSGNFGSEQYTEAVGGSDGERLYFSMKNSSGENELFVFDPRYNLLHKEDNTKIFGAGMFNNDFYILNQAGKLCKVNEDAQRSGVKWSAVLSEFNEVINERKGYSRLQLRCELEEGAYMEVEVSVDGSPFKSVKTIAGTGQKTCSIALPTNRCDRFKIRLSGEGGCTVMNIVREFITGSEV